MTTSDIDELPNDFPLPELEAIGDSVCEMLQFGVEEELLGPKILARLQGLLATGRVTTADVVRLALLADTLLVAEEAIGADTRVSESEANYVLALAQASAQRLGPFRQFYADLGPIGPGDLNAFMHAHRRDAQLFGGECPATRWLGLEIVRRMVQETGDRDPLDRYCELMLRLVEEIAELESEGGAPDLVRDAIEARLGLRKRLSEAQAEAPAQEDPRVRAFCSATAAEVFHAVSHAHQVWRDDPFDVESVHERTRALFGKLLARAAEQSGDEVGRVLLVLGDAGAGKTHLMRAFRQAVHGGRNGYVGYMQMSAPTDSYARYVMVHLVESLEKPYREPDVQKSGLLCLSDGLLMAPGLLDLAERKTLQEAELSDEQVCQLVFGMADRVLGDARFAELDIDLIRALLFLQRGDHRLHARVMKFLRCEPLGRYDLSLLGDLAPKSRPEDALRLLEQFGKLIATLDGGALVLLLDQLEDIYNLPERNERFSRAMDVVRHVSDSIPNALVVVSCLHDLYREMKVHLTRSVTDRIERDPEPQQLQGGRTLPEIEAMVSRRLRYLYESQGVRFRADEPLFPFTRAFLEPLARMPSREVLNVLRGFHKECIHAGALVALEPELVPAPEQQPPDHPELTAAQLSRQWNDFKASSEAQAPESEEAMAQLLGWALSVAGDELGAPAAFQARVSARGIEVDVRESAAGKAAALLVRLTDKSSRGGGLANQLQALVADAKHERRTPVALRSSDFGGAAGTALGKQIGGLVRAGGRRVIVQDADWRALATCQVFRAQAGDEAPLLAWLREEKPLLQLDVVRQILGLSDAALQPSEPEPARPSVRPASVRPKTLPPPQPRAIPAAAATAAPRPATAAIASGPLRVGRALSVKAEPVMVDPEQLKRHAAFLGASGSGKTSLALNLIEQLVERGVPALLLDRKGDLAAYADRAQAPTKEADPERERRRVQLLERAHVRLFTPGNPHGRPLRIRPIPSGIGALPAHERAQIVRFAAQGMGAMMGYGTKSADQTLLAILAKSIEVLGQLAGEREPSLNELIELLHDQDPSLIAELGYLEPKHFKKLVQHLVTLRLNHGALLESSDEPLSAEMLLGRGGDVPRGKVPLTIISTKFLGDSARIDFWVSQLLVELSRWASRSPAAHLQAVVFLDEADIYMPASTKPATKEPLQDLLNRARSAGLGVLLATQNPGQLDYKGRDSIGTWWLGRIGSPTAIEKMKPLLAECRTDVSGALATSGVGEFYQVHDGQAVRIRAERSLMATVQLPEDRILQLATPGNPTPTQKTRVPEPVPS